MSGGPTADPGHPRASFGAAGSSVDPRCAQVVICANRRLFGHALATALRAAGYRIVGLTVDPSAAAELAAREKPDACLVDLVCPPLCGTDAVDGVGLISAASPQTPILVIAGRQDCDLIARAIASGAHGFTPDDTNLPSMLATLRRLVDGEAALPAAALRQVVQNEIPPRGPVELAASFLTHRERQVLALLVQGGNTASMASRLGVEKATIRSHVQNLLIKLGVHTRLEAVALATSHHLVSPENGRGGDSSGGHR